MDGKDRAPSPISAPHFPLSAEITPAEYEYYMQKAQQMRAESMAHVFQSLFGAMRRLFWRREASPVRSRSDRHEPVLVKSRTA
jgi:hypothetical protein